VDSTNSIRSTRTCDWEGRKVLVTGGNGFIGSHLTEELVSQGASVTVVDRGDPNATQNLAAVYDSIEFRRLDLSEADFDDLLDCQPRFHAIFHLAGNATVPGSVENPWDDFQMNLTMSLRLMESIRRRPQETSLILVSSAAVYGDAVDVPISEATATRPLSPYGVSKLAMDRYASVYAKLYGLRIGVLRPFAVYGPRLRKQVIYDFMHKLQANPHRLDAHGNGTQLRDFCYVSDVVDAAVAIASRGKLEGEVYNVASGTGTSIQQILELLSARLGVDPDVQWSGDVRRGEPQRWIADISRLQALGWLPQVCLEVGLDRTVEWFTRTHSIATLPFR
jgi:UDP-glucose 4-epimerase